MQILAAEINFGYKFQSVRCLAFNGTPLRNLAHLARLVRSAQPAPEQHCTARNHVVGLRVCSRVQQGAAGSSRICEHTLLRRRAAWLRPSAGTTMLSYP